MVGVLMKYDLYSVKLVPYLHCVDHPSFHVEILRLVAEFYFSWLTETTQVSFSTVTF